MSEEDREDPDQNIRDIFDENDALNLAAVAFVHATKFEPYFEENGSVLLGTGLNEGRPVEKGFRTSVHFALNHHVGSHTKGNWDDAPFVVIGGFEDIYQKNSWQKKGHYFEDALETKTLMSFHPVDSWYNLGLYAKLEVPNATIIAPAKDPQNLPEEKLCAQEGSFIYYKNRDFSASDTTKLLSLRPSDLKVTLESKSEDDPIYQDCQKFLALDLPDFLKNFKETAPDTTFASHLETQGFQSDFISLVHDRLAYYSKLNATEEALHHLGYPHLSAADTWHCISEDPSRFTGKSLREDSLNQMAIDLGAVYGSQRFHTGTKEEKFEKLANSVLGRAVLFTQQFLQGKPYESKHGLDFICWGGEALEEMHACFQDEKLPISDKFSAIKYIEASTGINVLHVMPDGPWRDVEGETWYENIVAGRPHITKISQYKDSDPVRYAKLRNEQVLTIRRNIGGGFAREMRAFSKENLYRNLPERGLGDGGWMLRKILDNSAGAWDNTAAQKRGEGIWKKDIEGKHRLHRRDFKELKALIADKDVKHFAKSTSETPLPAGLEEKVQAKITETIEKIQNRQEARTQGKNAQKLGL